MTKKNTSTPPKMTATEKTNGKSGSSVKKNQIHPIASYVGVQIVSVIFHCIQRVFSIVDGLFVGIISVIVVCCVQDIISFVNNIEHQEKTPLRQPGQPDSTQEEGLLYQIHDETRT
jgi:hypothetical protein